MTSFNGFRFAELGPGESLNTPTTCDCCERDGLKKTVKLVSPGGNVVWYGTGCAARAMGCKPLAVRQGARAAETAAEAAERAIRDAAHRAADQAFQAFLDATAGRILDWSGKSDRFAQLEKLGGHARARALFKAQAG